MHGKQLLPEIENWLGDQATHFEGRITKLRARYARKHQAVTAKDLGPDVTRIDLLENLQARLVRAVRAAGPQGADALILAGVVLNEAGSRNDQERKAIAYAWLNRTKGTVRYPVGKEVSGYQKLHPRWQATPAGKRLSLVLDLVPSLEAAVHRLQDAHPSQHDPTQGATHWVSPRSPRKWRDKSARPHHYERVYRSGTAARAFPTWALAPGDKRIKTMQKKRQLGPNDREYTIPGVPGWDFLFYTGVR